MGYGGACLADHGKLPDQSSNQNKQYEVNMRITFGRGSRAQSTILPYQLAWRFVGAYLNVS